MSTVTRSPQKVPPPDFEDGVYYPASDGEPMAETDVHLLLMVSLIPALRRHFRPHKDVYVIGNMFLYYEQGNPHARRAPDIMIVKGVDATVARRSFKTWVEKAVPSAIFELTSKETAQEDQGPKRLLYQSLGVGEYFLFDPLHEYLPQPLMGFRLVAGVYEPMVPEADGSLVSSELGLRLRAEGADLALIDLNTGKRLLAPPEAYELVEELRNQGRQAETELKQMRKQAEEAEQRALQAEQRAQQLAAELARLRDRPPSPPRPDQP